MSPDAEAPLSAGDTTAHARWEAALADLEATLDDTTGTDTTDTDATGTDTTVDGTTAGTATPWSAPTGLGPVPRDLVGRASRLLAAQRDRITAVEDARRVTLEHLGALRAVDATRTPQAAVYLDASA
ncbi:hypothetical protein [Curtobacterium sp. PsM8]|uniref:hypothetical protein n=1 Tax=Curtobacterium sp. PsM8 TaxID=3030532 RepID=UPI00263AA6A0|nr:hypothetical protein [Curtobacterium sp. PsM8]MDN4648665.1 hypothetical protein [Curtobacterium sp. PsM8]